MRNHIACAVAIALTLTSSAAFAQTPKQETPKPAHADRLHLGQRIRDGLRAGQLTRAEVQRLRQRLAGIREHAKALRGDGTLTPDERRTLRREWRRASRALFVMRHNNIGRGR